MVQKALPLMKDGGAILMTGSIAGVKGFPGCRYFKIKEVSMSLSMYDVTVPVLIRGLRILDQYLDRAVAFAAENSIDPKVLVNARLAPDMQPLSGQVQRSSDTSKGAIARLTDLKVPSFPDTESTFEELKKRIADTVAFLNTVTPADLENGQSKTTELKFKTGAVTVRGDAFVLQFLLPNFFFHVTTAHDILRHNGVKIGKRDYLGDFG
jgi:hypothetical protein